MIETVSRIGIAVHIVLLSMMLIACTDDSSNATPAFVQKKEAQPAIEADLVEDVVIKIGNLADVTGPSSNALSIIDIALNDMVAYYNKENLIPGVELEVISYDGQYDPSRDIPGYQWLKEKGADIIWTAVASAATILKSHAEDDKLVLFSLASNSEIVQPPGYVFSPGATECEYQMYTLLKWITENDPEFPKDRPAKIGGTGWNEAAHMAFLNGMENYAKANPDEYEWEGGHLIAVGNFFWDTEAAALKDCDYLFPAYPPKQFVQTYRRLGGNGKLIGTEAHIVFLGQVADADIWDEMDGMLVARPSRWWNEDCDFVDFIKRLLYENHSHEAEEIIGTGGGYLAMHPVFIMLESIRETLANMDPHQFSSEILYNNLQSYSIAIDGCQHSFTDTKRTSSDHLAIYELRAGEEDIFRADPEWQHVLSSP